MRKLENWFPYSICCGYPVIVITLLGMMIAIYVSFAMIHVNRWRYITHNTLPEGISQQHQIEPKVGH